jgi:ferredoxin--NADP+ reductase
MYNILEKKVLGPNVKQFILAAPAIAKKRKPGQFVMIRTYQHSERFPLTIADADPEKETITIIFQEVGKSTFELGLLEAGDFIMDVVGPLGMATEVENFGRVVCMGGGVGVAEIYPVARAMKDAGNEVISIIGARTHSLVILEDHMKQASHKLWVTTDDGSYGYPGVVTGPLNDLLCDPKTKINRVFCIGPVPMMRAVAEATRTYKIPTIVSLNPIMVDGTGMCGACRVEVDGQTKFACVDGPDFDAHKVDFDLLVQRQGMYVEQEKRSWEQWKQKHEKLIEKEA